uniref:Uncharacterized protein n=1 Tax=Anopheles maculatus TaxID=74869 RepID=A0A182T8V1_9DIPT
MKKRRKKRRKTLSTSICDAPESRNTSTPDSSKTKPMGAFGAVETQQQRTDSTAQDEFIIPRERVISICNMDKNALDGYLNCEEENSQDQDQELLKYFPEEDGAGGSSVQQLDSSVDNDGATGGPSSSFGTGLFDDNEKLFQIRMILEKNQSNQNKQQMLQQQQQQQQQQQMQQALESHLAGYDTASAVNQGMGGLQPGSAAASLAALSQRHNTTTGDPTTAVGGDASSVLAPDHHQRQQLKPHDVGLPAPGYAMNQLNGTSPGGNQALSQTLQSPTTRRKNFSF